MSEIATIIETVKNRAAYPHNMRKFVVEDPEQERRLIAEAQDYADARVRDNPEIYSVVDAEAEYRAGRLWLCGVNVTPSPRSKR